MSELIFVKPAPGGRVRLPARDFAVLPDAGDFVDRDTFIIRRLADGDVVEAAPPAAEPPPPSTGSQTPKGGKTGSAQTAQE